MKRILSILLAICLMLPAASAFALFDFTGTLGNEATFETLEEARENGPAVIADAPDSAASLVRWIDGGRRVARTRKDLSP